MKRQQHLPTKANTTTNTKRPCRRIQAALTALIAASAGPLLPSVSAAPAPPHGVVAANIDVIVNTFDNDTDAVTLSTPYRIGDFRLVPELSNNGDYATQVGATRTNDVDGGIMMTSVRENGRDNESIQYPGTNLCTSHIDYHKPGTTNSAGELVENGYWIPIALTRPNALGTSVGEWDINVAAAWFPYDRWIGGFARNETFENTGQLNLFTGSPGLALDTNFKDLGGGKAIVDLTSLGIDSRTDGVLLVVGAKNEDNYALSQVNTADGTWNLFSKDNGTDGGSTEQDPLAFVLIPKTETNVISGRFLGDGTIDMHSGESAQFTVSPVDVGTWELKVIGYLPRFGVLILSQEGGLSGNRDNIVTYQVNDAGDGWIIQSWDLPSPVNDAGFPPFFPPPLETPGDGTEPVADFVFIPGPTPGFAVTPTNNLYTTENGATTQFTVALDAQPTADVTIDVASDNAAEGIASPASLTFTPADWNEPQTVTITGQDDGIEDGPVGYNVVLSPATSADTEYYGLDPSDVAVINLDNETAITVVPISGLITTEDGGTAAFNVVLNMAPTDDVVIDVSSSDTTEGNVSPSSLTFTPANWSQVQNVTITGADDSVQDGDIAYTIVTEPPVSGDANFSGKNPPDVSVVNLDDDTGSLNVSAAGPEGLTVIEGGMNSFDVVLNSQPTADVVVDLTLSDSVQGGVVSLASLTFTSTDWDVPQTVTVSGADDLVSDGDTVWEITNSVTSWDTVYAGLSPIIVSATTLDNEPAVILPSGSAIYGMGAPAVGLDGRATILDPNTASLNGATLTVEVTSGGTADDRLEVRNTGNGAGEIGVSGSNISYEGTMIGSFSGGVGTSPLVATFNTAATPQSAEALLRNVTFRNTNSSPSPVLRSVEVTLAHADGGAGRAMTSVRVGLLRVSDFQEGADRGYGVYTGEFDIELFEDQADVTFPAGHSGDASEPRMWVDARAELTPQEAQVLMRFENITGTEPGQIPPDAIIVSAELILNVFNPGDGSPLFRMLTPWDAEFSTWLSFGDGVQLDDFMARSTFDSQIGVSPVGGSTGTGRISVSVTPDIQAWVNGEDNYGWAMTSWDQDLDSNWNRGTDGMGFRLSEFPDVDERPRLRVLWVPAGTAMVSFRQGVNGYSSASDTRIRQREQDADTDFSTVTTAFVDWEVSSGSQNEEQVLLRFDDIVGTNPGQIPPGAHIEAAMLDLASTSNNGYGDGGQFFAMLSPWQDTDTWNTLIDGVQTDGVEAATNPSATAGSSALDPNVPGGFFSFDVTSDVQNWASGSNVNYGWAILPWPGGGDGWGIETADTSVERDRPQLRVFYTPGIVPLQLFSPVVTPTSVEVHFTGEADATVTVWRSGEVGGPWMNIGSATIDGDGTGTFTDSSPMEGSAFYRISNP